LSRPVDGLLEMFEKLKAELRAEGVGVLEGDLDSVDEIQ
jgi:hypothetical protein